MRKLSKIMLSVAAASVVTVAMAVTAMAVDTITGTYNDETGVVTMDGVVGSGASQTLLVFNSGADEENLSASDIAYINQIDNNGTFSTFTLPAGLKASAPITYYIRVGGTDTSVQTGTLTIEATPTVTTVTIIIGDVDNNNQVNMTDIARIGRYVNGITAGIGDTGKIKTKPDNSTLTVGDVDDNDQVNMTDIARIGRYVNGITTGIVNTGQSVEVIADVAAE